MTLPISDSGGIDPSTSKLKVMERKEKKHTAIHISVLSIASF